MPRGVYERKSKQKPEEATVDEQPTELTDTEKEADAQAEAARAELTEEGDLCGECWPAGWPENGDAAECVHGTWTR